MTMSNQRKRHPQLTYEYTWNCLISSIVKDLQMGHSALNINDRNMVPKFRRDSHTRQK